MYHEKSRRGRLSRALQWLAVVLLSAFLAVQVGQFVRAINADMDRQAATALRQTVLEAAVQCYAVEGAYPTSLDYLQTNYGVRINEKKFRVSYEAFASNLLPDVAVYLL